MGLEAVNGLWNLAVHTGIAKPACTGQTRRRFDQNVTADNDEITEAGRTTVRVWNRELASLARNHAVFDPDNRICEASLK